MKYIDIDTDATTFSSSSATLSIPSASANCFRIVYAGLYWSALVKSGDSRTDINKIKFKTPGSAVYNDIAGSIVYDAAEAPIVPDNNMPYVCYDDVTSLLTNLTIPNVINTLENLFTNQGF